METVIQDLIEEARRCRARIRLCIYMLKAISREYGVDIDLEGIDRG